MAGEIFYRYGNVRHRPEYQPDQSGEKRRKAYPYGIYLLGGDYGGVYRCAVADGDVLYGVVGGIVEFCRFVAVEHFYNRNYNEIELYALKIYLENRWRRLSVFIFIKKKEHINRCDNACSLLYSRECALC